MDNFDQKTIVVALGGNALQRQGEASAAAQQRVARQTAQALIPLVRANHRVVIVHGNGPQVGNIVLHEEAINTPEVPTMPLDSCVAMSQGSIGFWLAQALGNELRAEGDTHQVTTIITQTEVDANDPAFAAPTKPIGPFYSQAEAEHQATTRGIAVKEDAGRGWRRVVPSPQPLRVVEHTAIVGLLTAGHVVVAAGGGGVPVVMTDTGYQGVEAVIDKDFSAALLADMIAADTLMILTAVDGVMVHYGTADQRRLDKVTADDLTIYANQGHFAPGSMLPKVEAAQRFVRGGPGRSAVIADLSMAAQAFAGQAGTTITL